MTILFIGSSLHVRSGNLCWMMSKTLPRGGCLFLLVKIISLSTTSWCIFEEQCHYTNILTLSVSIDIFASDLTWILNMIFDLLSYFLVGFSVDSRLLVLMQYFIICSIALKCNSLATPQQRIRSQTAFQISGLLHLVGYIDLPTPFLNFYWFFSLSISSLSH